MNSRCAHCGASTLWDDSVSSAVCTECGSLADPSQSVLTSSAFVNQNDTFEPSLWDPAVPITLKGIRRGNNWDLAGQGKEARDRKNMFATAEFIKSLAVSFNATGLSPRATTLFNQVRAASNIRWGQKSRTVAGACLAIAFREANRPDSLRDIATLLDVSPQTVSREFTSIMAMLKLNLTLVDPSVYISSIHNHLLSTLRNPNANEISSPARKALDNLCLRSASQTATSLSHLLTRLCPEHEIVRLPVAPTACGIFLLAMEAERRSAINQLGDLAQLLASTCHSTKGVVMARYKTLQDEMALWIRKVPWLDKYESKGGRAAVAKRIVVARGLKDVIQFQEELWRQHVAPTLQLELEDTEQDASAQLEEETFSSSDIDHRPSKRQKLVQSLSTASQFLLNPHGTPLSTAPQRRATSNVGFPLATYILTHSSSSWSNRAPTRLQILARERGGVNEEQIPDEELFAEGELEKMQRSLEEVEVLRKALGWDIDDEASSAATKPSTTRRARSSTQVASGAASEGGGTAQKKSRINMEALALLLADDGDMEQERIVGDESSVTGLLLGDGLIDQSTSDPLDYDDFDFTFDAQGDISSSTTSRKRCASEMGGDEGEVVLANWRPPTPDQGGDDDCRYEQEYD